MYRILIVLVISLSATLAFAQLMPTGGVPNTTQNIGIKPTPTPPQSMLSVNTDGHARYIISAYSPSNTPGASAVYAEGAMGTGFANHVIALHGRITSGFSYTYGTRSSAYNTAPTGNGRAYGVWGEAGNGSPRANFGVYGRLLGVNSGAALIGVDDINHAGWNGLLPTGDSWAGYFLGSVQVTHNFGVRSVSAPQSMIAANTAGDSRHIVSAFSPSATSGSAAVYAEGAMGVGFADHVTALQGRITSGFGYTYGTRSSAYNTAPTGNGRAYGVWGEAGNASPGTNFGVYGRLLGVNSGAAVIGVDNITHPSWGGILPTGNSWAGYFLGNAHVTDRLGIGASDFTGISAAIGDSDYRLFVNGGIVGKKLLINSALPWADYVFEPHYELMPLTHVALHIQAHGHLPAMPSAADITARGGFEVGEITVKQQEKIEELFLHLIDMDKRLKELEAENQALRAKR